MFTKGKIATPTKVAEANSLQIDHWHFKRFKIFTNQNDHKSFASLTDYLDYNTLNSLTVFWLAESVQSIFKISARMPSSRALCCLKVSEEAKTWLPVFFRSVNNKLIKKFNAKRFLKHIYKKVNDVSALRYAIIKLRSESIRCEVNIQY